MPIGLSKPGCIALWIRCSLGWVANPGRLNELAEGGLNADPPDPEKADGPAGLNPGGAKAPGP